LAGPPFPVIVKVCPEIEIRVIDGGFAAATFNVPFVKPLVFHINPGPGIGGTRLVKAPE
jgi:hypothetical protein